MINWPNYYLIYVVSNVPFCHRARTPGYVPKKPTEKPAFFGWAHLKEPKNPDSFFSHDFSSKQHP